MQMFYNARAWVVRCSALEKHVSTLATDGWMIIRTGLAPGGSAVAARGGVLGARPGQRCLLDHTLVRQTAVDLQAELRAAGLLPDGAVAIQAIAFDKNPATNWKVTWHQDVMFPFARPVTFPNSPNPVSRTVSPMAASAREILEDLLPCACIFDELRRNQTALCGCSPAVIAWESSKAPR